MLKDSLTTEILIPVQIIDKKTGLGKERFAVQRQIQNRRKFKSRGDSRQETLRGEESEEMVRQRFTLEEQSSLNYTV